MVQNKENGRCFMIPLGSKMKKAKGVKKCGELHNGKHMYGLSEAICRLNSLQIAFFMCVFDC